MGARASVRQLRNHTSEVIEQAARHGSVTITSHGRPVATLTAAPADDWAATVRATLESLGSPYDSGLAEILAADDALDLELDESE